MKTYQKMTVKAAQRLLVAIIKQAVKDYRAFEKRGLIVNGRVMKPAKRRGPFVGRKACRCLVKFLSPDGAMDRLIKVGRLAVRGDAIRDHLGMDTTTPVTPRRTP
jgi:hypothetical protein